MTDSSTSQELHPRYQNMTRYQKLSRLLAIMHTVEEDRLVMSRWVNRPVEHECGFSGCCLGWATTDPIFNALGLKFAPQLDPSRIQLDDILYTDGNEEIHSNFYAGREFFELTEMESEFLFIPSQYSFDTMYGAVEAEVERQIPWDLRHAMVVENRSDYIPLDVVIRRLEYVKDNPRVLAYEVER